MNRHFRRDLPLVRNLRANWERTELAPDSHEATLDGSGGQYPLARGQGLLVFLHLLSPPPIPPPFSSQRSSPYKGFNSIFVSRSALSCLHTDSGRCAQGSPLNLHSQLRFGLLSFLLSAMDSPSLQTSDNLAPKQNNRNQLSQAFGLPMIQSS